MLVHWCVVIGSVRYQHWLLNNELGDTGEIDRDAGLITSLHSARMLLTINITITHSLRIYTMGWALDTGQ